MKEHVTEGRYIDYNVERTSALRFDYKGILERLGNIYRDPGFTGEWLLLGCYDTTIPAASLKRAGRSDEYLQDNWLEVETVSQKIRPQKNGQSGYLIYARVKVSGT